MAKNWRVHAPFAQNWQVQLHSLHPLLRGPCNSFDRRHLKCVLPWTCFLGESLNHQKYNLRWHDYPQSVVTSFRHLKEDEDFVDVTLACNSQQFTAHKVVLSACSPYFKNLLKVGFLKHFCFLLDEYYQITVLSWLPNEIGFLGWLKNLVPKDY